MRVFLLLFLLPLPTAGAQTPLARDLAAAADRAMAAGHAPGVVIRAQQLDGAVDVTVVRGVAAEAPARETWNEGSLPATGRTFDLASLTKCVATATCVMKLVEEGRLKLSDRAADHLPGFGVNGKDVITVEQLLRHRGGLLPDNRLADYRDGARLARKRIYALGLRAAPGTRYIYTDVGFIVLAWIVEKVTEQPFDAYAKAAVFAPCGMAHTGFLRGGAPKAAWSARSIPTEPAREGGAPLRGVVHDPRARLLGGVAGHAGLFSTIDDLSRYARMILRGGVADDGTRVLTAATIRLMGRCGPLPRLERRGLGFDLRPLAFTRKGPRGRHFPDGTFGHTGFTGTSMWMDPASKSYVIVLTSRLHPDGRGDVSQLRYDVGTAVAKALDPRPWALRLGPARSGLQRIADGEVLPALTGKRIGLITNHTARDRTGASAIERLHPHGLRALFSPEHGIAGKFDARVGDAVDPLTGLKIHSLYQKDRRRPSKAALKDLDVLVFDIQDIGTRFYTYVSTMVNCMEEASRNGLSFVVLDRPNPIGVAVEGPIANDDALDFVGRLRIPIRHGMTVGELARLAKQDLKLDLDLQVVAVKDWSPNQYLDDTGQRWVNPSPNMRSMAAALLYPGIGILETTNLSVGRGTKTPFEHVGAPWMNGEAIANDLRAAALDGITFSPVTFTPTSSKYRGKRCSGVRFAITDRTALRPIRVGLTLATALRKHHPVQWDTARLGRLLKHRKTLIAIRRGRGVTDIEKTWTSEVAAFRERRKAALIYAR